MNKLVFESLNELNNFEKKKDPLSSLGVGQIHMIKDWLDEMGVKDYTINPDLTIDVKGNVRLDSKDLSKFPSYIRFNKVGGRFTCYNNQLTSLEGCPSKVVGHFSCHNNQLTGLEGCPNQVGGNFDCRDNSVEFTKEDVLKHCKVDKGGIYV